tara:strand:+ start:981 stop:1499 length:519 start_codon:yes stop_codon:yes gene_type:complete
MNAIQNYQYIGIQKRTPSKQRIVHAFDLDDTLTIKPDGFNSAGMTKDDFFDAARSFPPDLAITDLLRLMHKFGDRIAICTARPPERLFESYQWLTKWRIPFDCLMVSTGIECSGIAKQYMLKYLRKQYRMVGTLIDDSPYNIQGAAFQRIKRIHVLKNCEYWDLHPEIVKKV